MILTIKKNKDFARIFAHGKRYSKQGITLIIDENKDRLVRFGFCLSKKLGSAVRRNKIKRQLKAIVFQLLPAIKLNLDIIVLAVQVPEDITFNELKQNLICLCRKAKILKQDFENLGK